MTKWSGSSPRMNTPPMLGDLAAGADPHTVASRDVIEKLDEPGDPAGAAGQPVVQSQRHQLGMVGALRVHDLEAIDHVAGKIIAGREAAILIEPVVVGLKGIRNDQVARIADRHPIREFVVQRVSVIQKAAQLDMKAPGVDARPAGHPANRQRVRSSRCRGGHARARPLPASSGNRANDSHG